MATTNSGTIDLMRTISADPLVPIVSTLVIPLVILIFKTGKISERFNKLCEELKDFRGEFKNLGEEFRILEKTNVSIVAFLTTKFGVDSGLFSSKSPLTLKEKGLKLLEKSSFKEIYFKDKNCFLDYFRKKNPKTRAEIDRLANEFMFNWQKEPENERVEKLSQVAFENGIPLPALLQVCAIFLRDEVIKELKKELSLK